MVTFYIYTIMHLDINNTFLIAFDAFGMILTFISVANVCIVRYPTSLGTRGSAGFLDGGETKYGDLRGKYI